MWRHRAIDQAKESALRRGRDYWRRVVMDLADLHAAGLGVKCRCGLSNCRSAARLSDKAIQQEVQRLDERDFGPHSY
jgi:hypothetical protein